jgi:hypothetical protein
MPEIVAYEKFRLPLKKRIEYLTMAVSNARSASSGDFGASSSILSSLVDSLDVSCFRGGRRMIVLIRL